MGEVFPGTSLVIGTGGHARSPFGGNDYIMSFSLDKFTQVLLSYPFLVEVGAVKEIDAPITTLVVHLLGCSLICPSHRRT